jgi:cell division septation protein DedD
LQVNGSIPEPSAAAQAAVTPPPASTAEQPPSTVVGANPATPQQSSAPAGQSDSLAGAPTGAAAAAQVRAALADNAPEATLAVAAPNVDLVVRPALPAALPLMVQIAAVAHAEDADMLVGALRKRGYTVTALREPADNLIHVRIGPFYSRDEANRWREKLLDDGYNAIIQP